MKLRQLAAALSRPPRRRLTQLFAASTLLSLVLTSTALTAAAATAPIRFGVHIGSMGSCVTIWSAVGETANLVWRDANGVLKAQASNLSTDGLWFFCPGDLAVAIGDRLKVTDETSTRTFVVPDMTINQERVTDTFSGTGPASRTLRIQVSHGDVGIAKSVRVGPDGTWSFHSNNMSISGGDYAGLSWRSPHDDQVSTDGTAPFVVVTLGRAGFSGYAIPNQDVDVALEDGIDAVGSATASSTGEFASKFRDAADNLRPAAAGDRLTAPSIASDANWIIPEIDGAADAASDIVEGQCHDNGTLGYITVELYRTGQRRGYASLGYNTGSFRFNFRKVGDFFADPANVKHGDQIVIQCHQDTGDIAQLKFIVP